MPLRVFLTNYISGLQSTSESQLNLFKMFTFIYTAIGPVGFFAFQIDGCRIN